MLEIHNISRSYTGSSQTHPVIAHLNLTVCDHDFFVIVGPSGCGKSTLLRIISGLAEYEDGIVERNGHKVEGPGPQCGNRKRACQQSEDSFIG